MFPQRKPQSISISNSNAIPELSLEAYPNILSVPAVPQSTEFTRPSKSCHTPVDWTRYWVERMAKGLATQGISGLLGDQYVKVLQDFLEKHPGAPSKHGPEVIGSYLRKSQMARSMEGPQEKVVLAALCFFYEHVLKAPKCLYGIPRSEAPRTAQVEKHRWSSGPADGPLPSLASLASLDRVLAGFAIKIPVTLQSQISSYLRLAVPVVYLFEGNRAGKPLTKTGLQASFTKRAGKKSPADTLTNRLWIPSKGADLRFTQAYLGHQWG